MTSHQRRNGDSGGRVDELHCVSVIIPAFNEADRITATVTAAKRLPHVCEVIVVDDGSNDATAERARGANATKVMKLERNCGKGAALNAGWQYATGEVLLFVDADLGESASNLDVVIKPVLDGEVDMAIGAPPPAPITGGFGIARALSRWAIRQIGGFEPSAPLSGQRALRRQLLERINKLANGFGVETALTMDALMLGARIAEVPVQIEHRFTGRNWRGFLHRARQCWDILKAALPRIIAWKLHRRSRRKCLR